MAVEDGDRKGPVRKATKSELSRRELLNHPWLARVVASTGGQYKKIDRLTVADLKRMQFMLESFANNFEVASVLVSQLPDGQLDTVGVQKIEEALNVLDRCSNLVISCAKAADIHDRIEKDKERDNEP